jgi:hypothetical protein
MGDRVVGAHTDLHSDQGGDIIYRPVQALQALSRFQRLDAGSGRSSSQGKPKTRNTCATATSSRPPSRPMTRQSTSARSALSSSTRERHELEW